MVVPDESYPSKFRQGQILSVDSADHLGVDSGDRLSFVASESADKRPNEPFEAVPIRPQQILWTLATRLWTLPAAIHKESIGYESYPVDSAGQASTRNSNIFN